MKTNNNTTKVTKENKSEMGMNRNEFFEYKKQRCMDLARKGATVGEIAKDLAMTEKEMYAFLSRNFGGIRQMREATNTGVKKVRKAAMSIPASDKGKNKVSKSDNKPNSILSVLGSALETEKQKLLANFKEEIELESKSVITEAKVALTQLREELLENFKGSLMSDLSNIAKSL